VKIIREVGWSEVSPVTSLQELIFCYPPLKKVEKLRKESACLILDFRERQALPLLTALIKVQSFLFILQQAPLPTPNSQL
jgi:hypothetical protein